MTLESKDLYDLDQRADRMLDGMNVNREKLARDIKTLTHEVRNWRRAYERAKREGPKTGFASVFEEMFGGRHG